MCGIVAYIDKTCKTSHKELVNMTNALEHRGPDSGNTQEIYFNHTTKIGLGHRRLSIIDLSSLGNQPMSKHGITIVFNGEIYNYNKLKKELIEYGYVFKSNSDTEVLISGYHKWGIGLFQKLNGMFACIFFDSHNDKILFLRDRAGVKPMYLFKKDNLILASSQVRSFYHHHSFNPTIDLDSTASFLQYGYIPKNYSIYKNISKVKPGYCYTYNLETEETEEINYWDVKNYYQKPKIKVPINEAKRELTNILSSAFNYRMVSDVPIGVFLSGGYDSSAVAAIIQSNATNKLNTYTIGFKDENYNEANYAKNIADHLGTNHHELYCDVKEAKEIIPELPNIFDEPFGDSSAIPTILVSRFAKKDVTVALSADGGDEIFGGYEKYTRSLNYYDKLKNIKFRKQINAITSIFPFKHPKYIKFQSLLRSKKNTTALNIMQYGSQMLPNSMLTELLNVKFNFQKSHFDDHSVDLSEIDNLLQTDYITYLPNDILVKVDRSSMSCSLESREPFLDHRIIEYVARLNSDYKVNKGQKKLLLKEIVHDYIPKNLLDRPKKGFSLPIHNWLKGDLRYLIEEYLSEENLKQHDIFNFAKVDTLKKEFFSGYKPFNNIIWNLLMFQMWFNKWHK